MKESVGRAPVWVPDKKGCRVAIEILIEEQECPFCHFAELKRDGDEIVCPICGCGFILNGESIQDSP